MGDWSDQKRYGRILPRMEIRERYVPPRAREPSVCPHCLEPVDGCECLPGEALRPCRLEYGENDWCPEHNRPYNQCSSHAYCHTHRRWYCPYNKPPKEEPTMGEMLPMSITAETVKLIDGWVGQLLDPVNSSVIWQSEVFPHTEYSSDPEHISPRDLALNAAKQRRSDVMKSLFGNA